MTSCPDPPFYPLHASRCTSPPEHTVVHGLRDLAERRDGNGVCIDARTRRRSERNLDKKVVYAESSADDGKGGSSSGSLSLSGSGSDSEVGSDFKEPSDSGSAFASDRGYDLAEKETPGRKRGRPVM